MLVQKTDWFLDKSVERFARLHEDWRFVATAKGRARRRARNTFPARRSGTPRRPFLVIFWFSPRARRRGVFLVWCFHTYRWGVKQRTILCFQIHVVHAHAHRCACTCTCTCSCTCTHTCAYAHVHAHVCACACAFQHYMCMCMHEMSDGNARTLCFLSSLAVIAKLFVLAAAATK